MKIPNNTVAILLFEDNPTAISVFLACIKYGIVPLLAGKKNDNDVFLIILFLRLLFPMMKTN